MESNTANMQSSGLATGIGRKLDLLISRKVEPFALLKISSWAKCAHNSKKRLDTSSFGFMAMKP